MSTQQSLASSHGEEAVLARLDPPLNLMHMPKTPLRRKLSQLRKALA